MLLRVGWEGGSRLGSAGPQAAKDKKCAQFDSDFRIELFYLPLPGQTGTGPALDRARAAAGRLSAAAAAAAGGSFTPTVAHPSAAAAPAPAPAAPADRPLASDRDAHHRAVQALAALGHPAPSFDAWLLGRAAAPGPQPHRTAAPATRPGPSEAPMPPAPSPLPPTYAGPAVLQFGDPVGSPRA